MKKWLLLFAVLLFALPVCALEVVYPRTTMPTISSATTFFVGNTQAPLKINGADVLVHPSGSFAYVVQLNSGANVFTLESGDEKQVYVINRPMPVTGGSYIPPVLTEYDAPINMIVSADNAPLRSTPVDAGINRLSHLPCGVGLVVDGEKGEFYRVVLDNNTKAWIAKSNVKLDIGQSAVICNYEHTQTDDYDIYTFDICGKAPYIITEGNPLKLTFYKGDDSSVYEFLLKHKLYGYSGGFDGDKFVLKIRKCPRFKVVIDPGHGGSEIGSISCLGDKEKDLNLAIAKLLEEELKLRGAEVVMTREDDSYAGLQQRVDIANTNDATIFVSIHANALPDSLDPNKYRGTSVYYYYDQAKPLAQAVLNSVTAGAGTQNDGVHQGSLAVVRNTQAVSILVEVGYMINPDDSALLADYNFQKKCAESIADGIQNYLKN